MSVREDGGPAFPQNEFSAYAHDRDGMTLRDWFAGQALAAIIAKSPFKSGTLAEMRASGDIEARAASAYDYADAMLAERSKP